MFANYNLGFARSAAESKYQELWYGLVSSWVPALGNTGLLVPDYSGKRNNGTQVGLDPATDWLTGKYGSFLEFTGDGEYVTVPHDIGGQVMSVVVWVKPSFSHNIGSPFSNNILGAGAISGGHFQLYYDSATGSKRYTFTYRYAFGATITLQGSQYSSDADFQKWTPVCITYDNNKNTQELFVNGISEASDTLGTGTYPGNTGWRIGDASLGNRSWTGGIASVQVYNRVLDNREIELLSTRPGIIHEKSPVFAQLFQGGGGGGGSTIPVFINHYRNQGIL